MRKLLIILLFLPLPLFGTDYYVKSSGNDSNTGLSDGQAWQTITKVNAVWSAGTFAPGDRILFNKGDTFYGTITVLESGSAGNPITLTSYGTGVNPVISGFTTITSGWTDEGGNIYSKSVTSDAKTRVVLIDGVQYGMGRFPKSTFNTFESYSTNVSITDNGLGDATDWAGADVVIRKAWWIMDRCHITDHTGDVLTYTAFDGSDTPSGSGYGYFIEDDLRTLSISPVYGEWFHDQTGGKLYVYFGASGPSGKTVKIATKSNLLQNSSEYDYITIDGITFEGSISHAVYSYPYGTANASNFTITNSVIQYAGQYGIFHSGNNASITYDTIRYCNQSAIHIDGTTNTVSHNYIKDIGLIAGLADRASKSNGIDTQSWMATHSCTMEYNDIINVGYNGIMGGSYTTVTARYNYIVNATATINDGGAFYHSGGADESAWLIDHNVILNSYGNGAGIPGEENSMGHGIYLDSWAQNTTVTNNTVAGCTGNGLKIGSAHDNTFEYNTSFNNEAALEVSGSWDYPSLYDNTIRYNIMFAKASNQLVLDHANWGGYDDIANYGISDYNYWARPINEGSTFSTREYPAAAVLRTLAGWRTYSGEDANSSVSLGTAIADTANINFIYNATGTAKAYTLSQAMDDVANTSYSGTITLQPYTSLILLGEGTVTENSSTTPTLLKSNGKYLRHNGKIMKL